MKNYKLRTNKFEKRCERLCGENYKNLLKYIREDVNFWGEVYMIIGR